jgi:hypothetical protein
LLAIASRAPLAIASKLAPTGIMFIEMSMGLPDVSPTLLLINEGRQPRFYLASATQIDRKVHAFSETSATPGASLRSETPLLLSRLG